MTGPYRRPGALDIVPPEAGSPWWEELAHALVLRSMPSEARRARATAPPDSVANVITLALKHFRPFCRRCERDVEQVFARRSADDPGMRILAACHGEQYAFTIAEHAIQVGAAAGRLDHEVFASFLHRELARPIFEPLPPAPPPPCGGCEVCLPLDGPED